MIKMIDKFTGVDMYVHESKVVKYLNEGHKLAEPPVKEEKPKRTRRKTR